MKETGSIPYNQARGYRFIGLALYSFLLDTVHIWANKGFKAVA